MPSPEVCALCALAKEHYLYEDEFSYARMKHWLRARGHIQVIPKRHLVNIWELSDAEAVGFFAAARKLANRLGSWPGVKSLAAVSSGSNQHLHLNLIPLRGEETLAIIMQQEIRLDDTEYDLEVARIRGLFRDLPHGRH